MEGNARMEEIMGAISNDLKDTDATTYNRVWGKLDKWFKEWHSHPNPDIGSIENMAELFTREA